MINELLIKLSESIDSISTYATIPGSEEIVNTLFPNVWVVVSHLIATLILIGGVVYFAWKPTKKFLKKRRELIDKNMVEAKEAKLLADKNLEYSKQELLDSKQTARQIINNANLEADELRKEIEASAKKRANLIEKEAQESIRKQEVELSKKMNAEISDLALDAAEMFLGEKIDKSKNKQLIDSIIKDLEESKIEIKK